MKSSFLPVAILACAPLIFVAYRYSRESFIVDRCLSGKHGSFDYVNMRCDLEENHVYIPYHVRHPRDEPVALLSFIPFAVFLLGYRYSRVS
jgi:hypothetical protein